MICLFINGSLKGQIKDITPDVPSYEIYVKPELPVKHNIESTIIIDKNGNEIEYDEFDYKTIEPEREIYTVKPYSYNGVILSFKIAYLRNKVASIDEIDSVIKQSGILPESKPIEYSGGIYEYIRRYNTPNDEEVSEVSLGMNPIRFEVPFDLSNLSDIDEHDARMAGRINNAVEDGEELTPEEREFINNWNNRGGSLFIEETGHFPTELIEEEPEQENPF